MNPGLFVRAPLTSLAGISHGFFLSALCVLALGCATHRTSPALLDPNDRYWQTSAPELFRVKFETTMGVFSVEIHRAWSPRGADRFFNLARAGFFDDSRFFRVRPAYIAQFGIPGDPKIAQIWRHQTFPDDPPGQSNLRGSLGFAMTGPNQRTTQLYFNLVDNRQLDSQGFTPIGRVVGGMNVVDQLFSGYGEQSGGGMRAGKQDKLFEEGNALLDRQFPKLDKIIRVTIEERTADGHG